MEKVFGHLQDGEARETGGMRYPKLRRTRTLAALAAGLLGLLGGCEAKLATVEGRVAYRGQTVRGGSVILYCADGQIVRGLIEPDGHFTVVNVPYGTARIAIQAHRPQPQGLRLPQKLPPSRDGPLAPLGLSPNDPRVVDLPARYAHPEESGLQVLVDQPRVTCDFDLRP